MSLRTEDASRETIEGLVAQLKAPQGNNIEAVTERLEKMSVKDPNKTSSIIAREEAIIHLLEAVVRGQPATQLSSANILVSLSQIHPNKLVQQRGIEVFIYLVSCGSPELKEIAAAGLENLAQQGFPKEIMIEGGTLPLLRLLEDQHEPLQHQSAKTLGKLACHSETRIWMAQLGVVRPLVQLLSSSSSSTRLKDDVAFTLRKLAFYNDQNRGEIVKAGAINPLVSLLACGNQEASINAAYALKELLPVNKKAIVKAIIHSNVPLESISSQDLQDLIKQHREKDQLPPKRRLSFIKSIFDSFIASPSPSPPSSPKSPPTPEPRMLRNRSSSAVAVPNFTASSNPIVDSSNSSGEWDDDLGHILKEIENLGIQFSILSIFYEAEIVPLRTKASVKSFNDHLRKSMKVHIIPNLSRETHPQERETVLKSLRYHEARVSQLSETSTIVIRAWYCVSSNKVERIVSLGFAEAGEFEHYGSFGEGVYLSTSPMRALEHRDNQSDPCLLMCYVILSNPFPVIWDDANKNFGSKDPFDSFYVPLVRTSNNKFSFPDQGVTARSELIVVLNEVSILVHSKVTLKKRVIIPPLSLESKIPSTPIKKLFSNPDSEPTSPLLSPSSQSQDTNRSDSSTTTQTSTSTSTSSSLSTSPVDLSHMIMSPPAPTVPRTRKEEKSSAKAIQINSYRLNRTHSKSSDISKPKQRYIAFKDLKMHYVLGQGGQGTVYRAEWQNIKVVVKKVRMQDIPTESERQIFKRELTAWMDATHENCVSMLGVIDEKDFFGFVAEYCRNGSLNLKFKNAAITGVQAIDIGKTIAEALTALHAKRLAHRDIKAANVMLDANFRAKLGDFGLSRLINSVGGTAAIGTFTHMAPEHIDSNSGLIESFKADVYSFGILMYELGLSQEMIRRNPVPNFELPSCISEKTRGLWWELAQKCTQKEPELRPTMADVYKSLCELTIPEVKCKKHGLKEHDIYISYSAESDKSAALSLQEELEKLTRETGEPIKAFLHTECLHDLNDWDSKILYGLHNSKLFVPIISYHSWDNIQLSPDDKLVKEYEHMIDCVNLSFGRIVPWLLGASPKNEFPDSSKQSKRPLSFTLDSILNCQAAKNTEEGVKDVAFMLKIKLQEKPAKNDPMPKIDTRTPARQNTVLSENNKDVGIMVEGQDKTLCVVFININGYIVDLREAIKKDIPFSFKFISRFIAGAPLAAGAEQKKKVSELLDDSSHILIRKID